MSSFRKVTTLGLCALAMYCMDTSYTAIGGIGFVPQAHAIVGRPATPVSYAGVARRTTYRAATTAAATSTTTVVVATPSTTAVGTTVATLPGGCVATTVGGVQYHQCGTVYYKPAYQGNNLVYIVSVP